MRKWLSVLRGSAPRSTELATAHAAGEADDDGAVDEMFPWLAGAIEYSDRYGSLVMHNRWLTRLAAVLGLGLVVACACIVYQAVHAQYVPPIVVQVDKTGFMVPIKVANETSKLEPEQVLGFAGRWVRALRTVRETPTAQMDLVDLVYAHLVPGSPAAVKVSEWFRKDNPLASGKSRTVEVDILRLFSGRSADEVTVEWRERSRSLDGEESKLYSAFLSVGYGGTPKQQNHLMINPVGLYVTGVQISLLTEEHDRP